MRQTSRLHKALNAGFTLIELMVVVTVLAMLATSAAPSFSAFLASLQVKAVAYDLGSDLLLARNEALKRNATVRVSPIGSDWTGGWKVDVAASGTRIGTRGAPSDSTRFTNAPASILFGGNGRVILPAEAVRITSGNSDVTTAMPRCVQLDLSGRARAEKGACP